MTKKRKQPSGTRLPFYYRFTKYISVFFVVGMVLLTLAWGHPDESIPGLLRRFLWLLLIVAVFIYMHFLAMEDEALKLIRAKRELEKQAAMESLLLKIGNRVTTAALKPRRISRIALAGLTGLIPLKKGFAALVKEDGDLYIAATWHLDRASALGLARRLAAQSLMPRPDNSHRPFLVQPRRESPESGPGYAWNDLMVIPLPGEKSQPVGFLAVERRRPVETENIRYLVDLFARSVGAAIQKGIMNRELARLSITDSMTELYNHRHYCERAAAEISRARRFGLELALMISDIDNFKNHVDTHGHMVGDATLRELGNVIRGCLRQSDLVARWGGDEFAYLLPQTDQAGAEAVAGKIQAALARRTFPESGGAPLTLSFGIAIFPAEGAEWIKLLEKADRAFFRAKSQGKNRVCAAVARETDHEAEGEAAPLPG